MNVDTVQYSRDADRARSADDGGHHEIRAVFTALSSGKAIILSCLIFFGAIAALVVWMLPGRYQAEATVLVQPVGDASPSNPATAQISPDMVRSQLEIVRSPGVLTHVIDGLGLMTDPAFAPPRGLRAGDADTARAIVIGNVEKRLKVDNDGRSVTIHIGFEANTPEKARSIVNAIANEYIRTANDLKNRAVALTASRLEERLSELRNDTIRAENAAEDFRRSVKLVPLAAPGDGDDDRPAGSTYVSRLLDQFGRQAAGISASADEARARAQIAGSDMAHSGGVNTPEILASPVISSFQQRDAELAATEASLTQRYTRNYPPVAQIRAQRAKLQAAILAERRNIQRSLAMQAAGAGAADRAAVARASALEQVVSRQTTEALRYHQLRREAATKRKIYEDLANRAGAIAERSLMTMPDAVLVSPASLPIKESWPNRPIFFAIGCLAALLIGCAAAVVGRLRQVYRRPRYAA